MRLFFVPKTDLISNRSPQGFSTNWGGSNSGFDGRKVISHAGALFESKKGTIFFENYRQKLRRRNVCVHEFAEEFSPQISCYYLTFIKYAAPYLSEKDLGQLLSDAWIMSEFPNADRNVGTRELLALFKSVSPEYLMDQKDWQRYQSLGDPVTVYRGVASADKGNVKALSWTLDRKTAEWFAHRFGKDGTVYTAQIKRDDICAYFSGRKESEVIVNPDRLEQIMVAPRQQIRETMKMK